MGAGRTGNLAPSYGPSPQALWTGCLNSGPCENEQVSAGRSRRLSQARTSTDCLLQISEKCQLPNLCRHTRQDVGTQKSSINEGGRKRGVDMYQYRDISVWDSAPVSVGHYAVDRRYGNVQYCQISQLPKCRRHTCQCIGAQESMWQEVMHISGRCRKRRHSNHLKSFRCLTSHSEPLRAQYPWANS